MAIIGIDEVGRGAIAGPIVAAAVMASGRGLPKGVKDSKEISSEKRSALSSLIEKQAVVGIGSASAREIDKIGIQLCNLLAMKRALEKLDFSKFDLVLVDGKFSKISLDKIGSGILIRSIVRGDSKIPVISAASICAKVFRDNLMKELHHENPLYGWCRNVGYGTKEHISALKAQGAVEGLHRRSFKVRLFA